MYDLHNLGWHSFQQLCLTIAREIFGQTVESFLDSADAGRDGAFTGTWIPSQGEALSGRFVIQCKFTSRRDKNLTQSDITDEVAKAKRLVKGGRCDCYILMTNAGLSGSVAQDVELLFKKAGVKQVVMFGSTWICDKIRENKRLRMLVPRIYGLGDLSQILDNRAYQQAKALLASLREDLSKVVLTAAYRRAAEALDRHGFVLLVGEPAAGKTTIASMLSMAALDQWGSSTLKLDDPRKVVEHWNPDEPSQFFWIDDAFGVMQYESFLVHGWNHILPQVKTMLRKGTKVVMTSRDYIYNRARKDLKEGAFPLLRESQVVIDVRKLTQEEKQQILYNHIKLGRQERPFRTAIKPHLESVASNSRFIPETARRLGDPLFTAELEIDRYHLNQFVEKQEQFLHEVLLGLDQHSKAALALIYMRNDSLESPIKLEESEREAIERLGSNLGGCITALESLNGSLAQYTHSEGVAVWRFKHPTVGDAFAGLLLQNPELLGIYVRGSSIDKLMGQITCGDVGLEHAVVLQKALFSLVLNRLSEFSSTTKYKSPLFSAMYTRNRLDGFLSSRCSKTFLAQYILEYPNTLDRVSKPGLFLSAVSEVDLAIRLHEFGLLPEEYRKVFVETVTSYAVEGEDLYALESVRIQSVFTSTELAQFRTRIRTELLPSLADVRRRWESNRALDQSPDEYMQPLLDSLSTLKEEFAGEPAILMDIDREIQRGKDWISDQMADDSQKDRPSRSFGDVDTSDHPPPHVRGIFDDVDD
ncbi:MAG: hypothetical protein HOP22_10285 [Nitrospiraceae bacterium]|nr:hypothetical protein [Nitrospiraceae bacterium]